MIPPVSASFSPSFNAILDSVDITNHRSLCNQVPIPSVLLIGTKILCRFHCLYCWQMEYRDVFLRTRSFRLYLVGNAVNLVMGSSGALQIAAQMVLIVRRIVDAINQTQVVYLAWNQLLVAWICPCTIEPTPDQTEWSLQLERLTWKLSLLSVEMGPLLWALWGLSVRYRLVLEGFSMTPAARSEAVNMLFVNGDRLANRFATHASLLLELREQKLLVQKILGLFHVDTSADDWIDTVEKDLQIVDMARNVGIEVQAIMRDGLRRSWLCVKFFCFG